MITVILIHTAAQNMSYCAELGISILPVLKIRDTTANQSRAQL
jgi:hypothetical protein